MIKIKAMLITFDYSLVSRDVVQPPVFVTAALKKKNLLSPGHVAVRRSRRYKTGQNTEFVFCRLHEM